VANRPKVLAKNNRKATTASEGFRQLTKPELRKLGRSETSRAFTTQKIDVKRLDASKVLSRRQAEQRSQSLGSSKTFETLAKAKRTANAGSAPLDRYSRSLDKYAKTNNLTKGDARKNADFQRLYKDSTNRSRTKQATVRRLEALYKLGVITKAEFNRLREKESLN